MNSNFQQGRVFCITGVKQPVGLSATSRKVIGQAETDSSGYVSSSSFESSGEERRLKLNEQKVFQVWEKWGQQMQGPKFSTPKSPRQARKCQQRPYSVGDISTITDNQLKSAIRIKKFGGEKGKRVVIKSLSDEECDVHSHSVHKTLSDGDLNKASHATLSKVKKPIDRPSVKCIPTEFRQTEKRDSVSSSRSCGSGQSDSSDFNSLPRMRTECDRRVCDGGEYSHVRQRPKSCDCTHSKGTSVDESMSEFLSNVNKENLESLLNFYDRVTANEKRRKQRNYEAVYY